MTEHEDQLREAFSTHENDTPDPGAVYARVQDLSQKYKRRRVGAQVAGGAVLSAGLVAGVLGVQQFIPGPADQNTAIVAPAAAPSASPAAAASPSAAPGAPAAAGGSEADLDAYFNAGYDYDDAVRLSALWKMDPTKLGSVKGEAGRRLLAGETLPFAATPDDNEPTESPISAKEQKQYDAFFGAGYTYDEAVKLAKIWHMNVDDIGPVKLEAGKQLLAGKKLPVRATPAGIASAKETKQFDAFFAAGYDYADAVQLAKIWKLKDAGAAKIEGGKRILAHKPLPIRP